MGNAVADESQIEAPSATRGGNRSTRAAADGAAVGSDEPADPWFTPGPKVAVGSPDDGEAAEYDAGVDADTAQWFMPTGRAGLVPDSMTESPDSETPDAQAMYSARSAAVGSPPWAGDSASPVSGEPPPWETGPWPGPGEPQLASRRPDPPAAPGDPVEDEADIAGARRRLLQLSLAAGAGVVVLVVIIVVIIAGTSGSPTGGCGTYPAAVHQAYTKAMTDLRTHAPASVEAAAFQQAASRANASAAAAGQIAVRSALFTMASDLDQADADITAHRTPSSALLQRLTADGTALPASCSS